MSKQPVIRTEFAKQWAEEARQWPEDGFMRALMDFTAAVCNEMAAQGVTRAELARRAGLKPSYISRILNSPENITMRTAFRLCHALGLKLAFDISPTQKPEQASSGKPAGRRHPEAKGNPPVAEKAAVVPH